MDLKIRIIFATVMLFIYNALFAYVIIALTTGPGRFVFLGLLALDYIIIFYFVLAVAKEVKFQKNTKEVMKRRKR